MVLFSSNLQSQNFEQLVAQISALPISQQQAVADSFMAANSAFPLLENDTTVLFIDQRAAISIAVTGDASNWDVKGFPLTRVGGTNLWYCKKNFESDARLDYKFVVNGKTWVLDERNPFTCVGGFGPNSELRMPCYTISPEYQVSPDIPHGALHDTTFHSNTLGNSRKVTIYTPPGYDASKDRFPVILFHDGLEYISLAQANNTIDYLISKKRIVPIIAVFVPPVNRTAEYVDSQIKDFSEFIVNDVMVAVDASYRTLQVPSARTVLGASNGGNISLWLGSHYPHVFGNVGAQSSNIIPALSERFRSEPKLNLKLYLDLGTYDIPVLIHLVRGFVPILKAREHTLRYREFHEGHSWGNWRAHLKDALEFFFGTAPDLTK